MATNIQQWLLHIVMLVIFSFLAAIFPAMLAMGGRLASLIMALPAIALLGYAAAHACLYVWMQISLRQSAAGEVTVDMKRGQATV